MGTTFAFSTTEGRNIQHQPHARPKQRNGMTSSQTTITKKINEYADSIDEFAII